ncbi:hypothetical protein [Corallococcus macrosporus]|uniref:Uncharacterized protein n=1 Tax=Myxococcus fulvus (strain ATCC BAA-855 / HW-1) TaxID=483219 RepID=F8CM70_MYXFH|nr:hypothetical protein [Corallococcus macrosporus]AEI62838.1 hypothetical protein LILAB_04585 [Corallococcus macrosporus]
MAFIHAQSRCAICHEAARDRPFIATSGVAFPPTDALWKFCDAPLYQDCLATWEHRIRFARGYFDRAHEVVWRDQGLLLLEGSGWFLSCGPPLSESLLSKAGASPSFRGARPGEPYYAEVLLAEWPKALYTRWHEWPGYAAGEFRRGLVGELLRAVESVMARVQRLAPDMASMNELRRQARERAPGP